MFVNRTQEIRTLNQEYKKKGSAFTVIYGRRRVGKTALIIHFIKQKPALYFYATELSISEQSSRFTKEIISFLKPAYTNISFDSFEQALLYFADHLGEQKVVLVFDEYQNLVKKDKAFSSVLQKVWDLTFQSKNIHLILCGSIISMMYSETLAYSSPLYGRRTSNIHLKPMLFQHIKNFISPVSKEDEMNIYASFRSEEHTSELQSH